MFFSDRASPFPLAAVHVDEVHDREADVVRVVARCAGVKVDLDDSASVVNLVRSGGTLSSGDWMPNS